MPEQRYKELVADIDGIVWEADAGTLHFTFVSEGAERLLGYPLDQWFSPGFWESHIYPDDRDTAVAACLETAAARRKHDFEYRMIAADGRTVWLRDIVNVTGGHAAPVKLRGVMMDITAQKTAEQERKAHLWFMESMDKINRAMHGASALEQMIGDVLDAVLTTLDCDCAWLLTPCTPEASAWRIQAERSRPGLPGLGAFVNDVPMSSDVAGVLRAVGAACEPVCFEIGSERPLSDLAQRFCVQSMMCTAILPKAEDSYVLGVHQCSRPRLWTPEERRLFHEVGLRLADSLTTLLVFRSLSESECRLADAEHLAHVGYWERDFVGGRFTFSDEACRMVGLAPGKRTTDLVEREERWREAIHPDDRVQTLRAAAAARRGDQRYDVEYRVVRPDGEVRVIHSRGDVIWDETGRPCRMFGFMQDITERKRAEAQLFEMTERFRLLSESSLTGIYLIQDGVFRYVNPALAKMFGYAPEDIIDKLGPTDIVYPEDQPVVAENVRRRIEGEIDEIHYEIRGAHKDGSMIHVEVHGRRIEYAGRVGVIGTLIDVTERRKVEDRLRASEARFRTLVDHATDAFYLYDETGIIIDVNRQACESLGYARQELIGMSPSQFDANAEAHSSFSERVRTQLREGKPIAFDSCHRRKDGSTFPVEVRLRPFQERGHWFSVGLARDITERKRAERALIESHSLLNGVVEGTSDAVFVKDLDGRYLMINSSGARFLGRTVADVLGKDDSQLFSAETAHVVMDLDRGVMTSGQSRTSEETASAAGVMRTYLSTKGVLRDAQGNVTGLIGIARDITDLKRLEEQFRQAQRMEAIGRLAGGVAHDFNNLLTVINGYGELALMQLATDDPNHQLLAEIIKAGERASTLTRQLLAFSRRQVLEPQVVSLNALIGDVCKMLSQLIGEDVELSFAADPSVGLVKVDPSQFEQAIMNLAVNARDAMPQGGRLTIETRNVDMREQELAHRAELRPARYVQVAVSDSGQGMDAATRTRIFEPFFTTKAPGKGTGLGLAMVYGFVKQSGGHIEVYSEPGHGTTFKIYFPSDQGAKETMRRISDIPKASRGTETVLLAEDDDDVRRFAKLALHSSGYVVLEAGNGKEALRIAAEYEGPIHILVTDLVMPHMAGGLLADSLTQARPEMRVLLMSGYTDEVVMHQRTPDSRFAFLQKPFTPKSLTMKLREVLDAPPGTHSTVQSH